MALMFNDTMYAVEHIIVSGGQTAILRRYMRSGVITGPGPLEEQDIANALADQYAPLYKPLIWNSAEYRGVLLTRQSGALPLTIATIGTPTAIGTGTGGSTAMSKQTAGVISLKTDNQGKKNRGRQYVPFPASTANTGTGVPTLLYLADLVALGVELRTARVYSNPALTETVTLTPVIWKKGQVAYSVITSMTARRAWGTQRKRGDFGRLNASPI